MKEKCRRFWWESPKKRNHSEDQGAGRRMGSDLRETGLRGVDWIRLAQDRDQWQAVVSAVINLQVLVPWS
jgi:hypothetical protein